MVDFLNNLFFSRQYIPHGHCYLWQPGLLWLHVLSDVFIALAYYSIPLLLIYFIRQRKDVPFKSIFILFSLFILSCGTTHVMSIWTLWYPAYWLSGLIKAITAIISLYTAFELIPILPQALALRSPKELEEANQALAREIDNRQQAEIALQQLNQELEAKIEQGIAKLRQSQERLQAIIDNTFNVIYLKDLQGRYLLINRQFEKLFHLTREQIIGKMDSEIFSSEIAAAFMNNDRKILAAAMPLEFEETAPQDDGLHTYISIKFPLWDAQGKIYGVCGISTDISERKRAEASLKQAQEVLHQTNAELERRVEQRTAELTQTNQQLVSEVDHRQLVEEKLRQSLKAVQRSNRELENFAYIVSHDLQEPLRKMKSFSQLLARECQGQLTENDKAQRYLDYIIDAADRQQKMIRALLVYSRLGRQDSNQVAVDLNLVVEKVLEDLSIPIAETGAKIIFRDLPTIRASPTQMAQLFLNLIGNGIKFQGEAPPIIQIEARLQQSEWLISVQDNGIGIKPKYAERIFQIFQRLHSRSEYSGTGIGLAICRKIVEAHGGRIWVTSEPGQGSTFYFTLPVSPVPVNNSDLQCAISF